MADEWVTLSGIPDEAYRYVIDQIKRVTTVSIGTMKIVDNLPPLREAE